jgi:hypothetical protein
MSTGQTVHTISGKLLSIEFEINFFEATFEMCDAERAFRISFKQQCIVRILDEFAISTEDGEEETPNEGLVQAHFAYRVEGATFFRTQSSVFKFVDAPTQHYRFITMATCLDVVSGAEPEFSVVSKT